MVSRVLTIAAGLLFAAATPAVLAQHGHGQEEHGKPVEFKMPTTYKDGVKEIEHRLHEIEELMGSKHLDDVHAQADVIKKIGEQIGQLAAKADSGVARDAVKEVNQTGKALASKFDAIDKAADSGDAAGTRKVYDEMVALTATLKKHVAAAYFCPMYCEGAKTYDKPGKCPKCGMDLKEMAIGAHGGMLLASADQKHHVEATLSPQGELRVYCYDANKKPVPCDKVSAEGKASKPGTGSAEAKAVALAPAPDKMSLTGKIDPALKTPVTAKVTMDFKDGQKAQGFDFYFEQPTKAEGHKNDEHKDHKP